MKELYIAEKSSAGKDIAKVLGLKEKDMKDGYMENDKYIVSWARGHLVGMKEAKEIYENAWDIDKLPFQIDVDRDLKVINEKGSASIFNTLKKLINRDDVECIINCGDSGREGELIQQWIYKMAGNKKTIKRLWTSSLTDESIKKAIDNLQPNDKYKNLYEEGKALKIIDWMYGMSYTVLLTKLYGNGELLVYGRCKTPLLNLIVERENEIRNFKKETYYVLNADFGSFKGVKLKLNEETNKYENDNLKFNNDTEKEEYKNKWKDIKEGIIKEYKKEDKESKCPKCFSLNTLQQLLGKKYGYTPDKTLEIAQSLYEKKFTTYPRTNSEYLTEDIWQEKDKHIDSCIEFVKSITSGDVVIDKNKEKSKDYVDNSKVEDHHAIIPTEIKADINSLSEEEKNGYIEICKRYISIFMESYKYESIQIITEINKEMFKTTGTKEKEVGYKALFLKDEKEEKENDEYNTLPIFNNGDKIDIKGYELKEQETKPKERYNVATIIKVMEKYGIGTPATQANIIEETIGQGVINIVSKGKKKEYIPTEKGEKLLELIPQELRKSDLCKSVEERIKEVGKGNKTLDNITKEIFTEQEETIKKLTQEAQNNPNKSFTKQEKEVIGLCPFCKKEMVETDKAYSHKEYKDNPCKFTIWKNGLFTTINKTMAKELLEKGETTGNFKSKEGKAYKQKIVLNKETQKLEKGEFVNSNKKRRTDYYTEKEGKAIRAELEEVMQKMINGEL